jgi:hypothetical protein
MREEAAKGVPADGNGICIMENGTLVRQFRLATSSPAPKYVGSCAFFSGSSPLGWKVLPKNRRIVAEHCNLHDCTMPWRSCLRKPLLPGEPSLGHKHTE